MRLKLTTTIGLIVLAATAGAAEAAERYGRQKVVYHISTEGGEESKAYLRALTNIQNHIDAVGRENIEVRVVMHGDGLNLLKEAKTQAQLQQRVTGLKGQNVAFDVCGNTVANRRIDPERDLFEVTKRDLVPSGVAELSHLQQQGYTYIRP
jgi:intracellular sulfur oxidation DsrE/DsrF family protein